MRHLLIFLTSFLLGMPVFAQIEYKEGYYFTNDSTRISGWIKDEGWRMNPNSISFKQKYNTDPIKLSMEDVLEFGIENTTRYVRANVRIDISTSTIQEVSDHKDPEFSDVKIFLKVLVEGKANLYFYEKDNLIKYFYSVDNKPIEQLIYKKYLVNEFQVAQNDQYKRQLWLDVRCSFEVKEEIERLQYQLRPLKNYFISFNRCVESDFLVYEYNSTKSKFNLTIKSGLDYSRLRNVYHIDRPPISFDGAINFRIGIDMEYSFPFAQNKWSVFLEPTYRTYSSSNESVSYGLLEVEYNSIEIPLGMRYSVYLNKTSKFFVDASFVFDLTLGGSFGSTMQVNSGECFALGVGYQYNRTLIQARYYTNRQIIKDYQYWSTEFSTIAVSVGYRLVGGS